MGEIEIRILEYLEYLSTCGYSTRTLKSKKYYLRIYLEWSEERGITKAEEMTESLAERYQGFVLKYRSIRKELLSVETQIHLIIAVKSFYLYLEKKEYIRKSPFLEIKLPRKGRRLPRNVECGRGRENFVSTRFRNTIRNTQPRYLRVILFHRDAAI
nr:phage integrase N-terminal SAM-like domain-containing protein [Leptospira interrogans]